jgi:hypothetical protein
MGDTFCSPTSPGSGCSIVLRGGSLYAPVSGPAGDTGSTAVGGLYALRALDASHHVTMPLWGASGSAVRSRYVGFRCLADTPQSALHWSDGGGRQA